MLDVSGRQGVVATGDEVQIVAGRLASQLLAGPHARSAVEVVSRLLAVQAQDGRGFRLSVRSRSTGLTATAVDDALSLDRTLVVSWLQRGTLHLVAAEDYWWLHPLTTPQLASLSDRRLRQEGVRPAAADAGVSLVVDAVTTEGPQTREQLRARLDDAGIPTKGQALVHVLLAASIRGDLVRGPVTGDEQAFVSAFTWLGAPPARLDRPTALARLARRYLAGHAPATAEDLARWAGITLGDARLGFAAIAEETAPVAGGRVLPMTRLRTAGPLPPPRLLGPFDPLLHGWVSRGPFVGPHTGVVTRNGIFRPVALVDGRVVATWSLPGGVPTIDPLEPISEEALGALRSDARDVLRFLGLPERTAAVR